jgi:hypothetical protein
MNDSDDRKLKSEIDEIMKNVNNIIKKIEEFDPVNSNKSVQNDN